LKIIFSKILHDKTQILVSKAALKQVISLTKELTKDSCVEFGTFLIKELMNDVTFEEEDAVIKEGVADV